MKTVYGDKAGWYETSNAMPISAAIKVDYAIPGCPLNSAEFLDLVKAVLAGRTWQLPDYPVCVECKLKENVCLFHKGQYCMGVITRAGCGAWCPSYGGRCYGCRGLITDPNCQAAKEVLDEFGLTVEDVLAEFRLFNGVCDIAQPPADARAE